jgi:hypothetical protein
MKNRGDKTCSFSFEFLKYTKELNLRTCELRTWSKEGDFVELLKLEIKKILCFHNR